MPDNITSLLSGVSGPHADGTEKTTIPMNSWGQQLASSWGPTYLEWARRGYIYVAATAAAAAIPIYTTCTNAPTLWNPADSGKLFVPIMVTICTEALGTPIITGLRLMYETGMSDTSGTAGMPFPTFTNIAPVGTYPGKNASAKGKFAAGTVTWTAQPANLMDLGMGMWKSGTSATGEPYSQFLFDFQGLVAIAPGTAVCVAANVATSTTFWTSIIYAELPNVV
jgi:hypothetical protein